MEVVGNVIETCDKEAGQKLLLKGRNVHMVEPFEGFGENKGREMLKVQNNFRKPQATRGRSAALMLCLSMTLIIVLSGTQRV